MEATTRILQNTLGLVQKLQSGFQTAITWREIALEKGQKQEIVAMGF